MKHNIKRIDYYENAYKREIIDYTCLNGIQYSIVNQYGEVKGYVKTDEEWKELNIEEAIREYQYVLKVIRYEVKKDLRSNEQKTLQKENKTYQNTFA